MTVLLLALAVLALAYANGANDNFKGVATLYGSGTTGFRTALAWSAFSTLAGSVVATVVAGALAESFSGRGLLPGGPDRAPEALLAVAAAGAGTVLLATRLGFPTSTTHALTGALLGAGLATAPGAIEWSILLSKFAQPLLLSPLVAVLAAALLYPSLRQVCSALGVTGKTCLCAGHAQDAWQPAWSFSTGRGSSFLRRLWRSPSASLGEESECRVLYQESLAGVSAQRGVDALHFLSAGSLCFARAVNDTPKIAAVLLVVGGTFEIAAIAAVSAAMALGGVLNSSRVAETMSLRITTLDPGQGLTANLVSTGLVLGASHLGLPVSTTHVSCGALFGVGLVTRAAKWRMIARILLAWVTTLPLGLALSAGLLYVLGILH